MHSSGFLALLPQGDTGDPAQFLSQQLRGLLGQLGACCAPQRGVEEALFSRWKVKAWQGRPALPCSLAGLSAPYFFIIPMA